ncbi:MAG: LacI family transcriptional regulator [Rhizobium sp.]|nr:LacI family transcriptional regulator [Rhizobium sp.]
MTTIPPKLTLLDIAARAGVSRSTASLALRGEPGVQPEKRARVLKIAEELNYTPDLSARRLASSSSGTIGVLLSDILNPFTATVAKSIDAVAREKGFDVILSLEGFTETGAEKAIQSLAAQGVAGLILIGSPESTSLIERVSQRLPVLYFGRHLASERVASVSNDDRLGASLVVRHLVGLGHRDIVHIDGGPSAGSQRRREAYRSAMEEAGLVPTVYSGRHTLDGGVQATEAILAQTKRPTAIFASNDMEAVGVLSRLLKDGVRVPGDIAVVGYDDIPFAESETMSLTTVRQPIQYMASQSLDILMSRMQKPDEPAVHVLVAPSLIARRTTQELQVAAE